MFDQALHVLGESLASLDQVAAAAEEEEEDVPGELERHDDLVVEVALLGNELPSLGVAR
jgi:hypothetical protein